MKSIKSIFLIAAITCFCFSCNNFLSDVKPETSQEVTTLRSSAADLDVLINGAFGALSANPGPANYSPYIEMLLSDLFKANPDPIIRTSWINSNEDYAYTTRFSTGDYQLQAYILQWGNFAVNMANTAVESIDKGMADADPKLPAQRDRIKGEGLFIRGMVNFDIVRLLGKQYHSTTLTSPAGVYRTKPIISPEDIPAPRTSVGETYEKIIADLETAEALLPDTYNEKAQSVAFLVRARKDVATALLARVYFQMNEFDKALDKVEKLLGPVSSAGSSKYPLATDYDKIYKITGNTNYGPDQGREVIYAFEGTSAQKGTRVDKWDLYKATNRTGNRARKLLVIGQPYKDLIDIAKDKRYTSLVENNGGQWWLKKFSTPDVNSVYMRAAEFHLMRAEILARKGDVTNALIELNLIKKRAGLDEFVSDDPQAIADEIISERARELIGENNRFWDLKRLGALTNGAVKVTLGEKDTQDRLYVGGADRLEWNSDLLQYLLPTNEKIYNPGL